MADGLLVRGHFFVTCLKAQCYYQTYRVYVIYEGRLLIVAIPILIFLASFCAPSPPDRTSPLPNRLNSSINHRAISRVPPGLLYTPCQQRQVWPGVLVLVSCCQRRGDSPHRAASIYRSTEACRGHGDCRTGLRQALHECLCHSCRECRLVYYPCDHLPCRIWYWRRVKCVCGCTRSHTGTAELYVFAR